MKQIEGKARRVIRNNKPLIAVMAIVNLGILAYIYGHREEVGATSLFVGVATFGIILGMAIALLLQDID